MNEHNDTVSVVMATYNGAIHLAAQLDSIAAQTWRPDELLIADDGSTDDTRGLLEGFAASHPWVRVLHNPSNFGVNVNFFKLLQQSRGDVVLLSDQDDLWLPDKIATLMAARGTADLCCSDAIVIDAGDREIHASELAMHGAMPHPGHDPLRYVFGNWVSGHNALVTRALVRQLPPPPEGMYYDQWLALNAALGNGIAFVPAALCRHRLHEGNVHNNAALRRQQRHQQERRSAALQHIARLQQALAALAALTGRDAGFDAAVAALTDGAEGLEARWFSPVLWRTLQQYRRQLFPGQKAAQVQRRIFKLSLGGYLWRWR